MKKQIKNSGKKIFDSKEKIIGSYKSLAPIFSGSPVSELIDEVLRENEYIRMEVIRNPNYRTLLEQKAKESVKRYDKLLKSAKAIDRWDRVTSAFGLAADFVPGIGTLASAMEEGVELIPKAIYAIKYKKITGDKKALKYWGTAEAASFIPYLGDLIDMSNIYLNRTRKTIKGNIQKEFLGLLNKSRGKNLEDKIVVLI